MNIKNETNFKDLFASAVENVEMSKIFRDNYLIYSSYILHERAIPDIRDGLKPINRRILFHMFDSNYTHNQIYKKSAKIVGEVMGRLHPHGDSSIYGAAVIMAQDFNNNLCSIDGHGAFGNIDEPRAASMRYTEMRLSGFAEDVLLSDLKHNVVDTRPNYSGDDKEPMVLPVKIPYVLINSITGIAIAYATSIPPHNLGEVIDGMVALVKKPTLSSKELMEYIKGPDYPTGGIIEGVSGLNSIYSSGTGYVNLNGVIEKKQNKKGEWVFTITEVPYEVRPSDIIDQIRKLVELEQVKVNNVIDISDKNHKVRIEITFHKSEDDPERLTGILYSKTYLSKRHSYNIMVLKDGTPVKCSVLEILRSFKKFREEVLFRKHKNESDNNSKRIHILEGLLKVNPVLDKVIELIRKSASVVEATNGLMHKFKLSNDQATYILRLSLSRLTKLEMDETRNEHSKLVERNKVLKVYMENNGSNKEVDKIMVDEWLAIKKKYAKPRKTLITTTVKHYDTAALIKSVPCMIITTKKGYIKRLPLTPQDMVQGRGGKGRNIPGLDFDDEVKEIIDCDTTTQLTLITSLGKVYNKNAYEIPESQGVGRRISNIFELNKREVPVLFTAFPDDIIRVALILKNGDIKVSRVSDMKGGVKITPDGKESRNKKGSRVMKMGPSDELVAAVGLTMKGSDQGIIMASANGKAVNLSAKDIRVSSSNSGGVKGMTLEGDDEVTSACGTASEFITVVTSSGFVKRIATSSIRRTARSSKGVKISNDGDEGKILYVGDKSEGVLTITISNGKMITFDLETIRTTGKSSKGVKVCQLNKDDYLVSVN